MFRDEGTTRPFRKNQLLAGYLALVAGYVNSAGFVLLGVLSSHVTGNVARLADRLARGDLGAGTAVAMIAAFYAGAFAASMRLESTVAGHRPRTYASLLALESGLIAIAALAIADRADVPVALLLCAAMGLQNSLVTRLSGAIVRTTHLTGVVTDLGIEGARWFRYLRSSVGARMHVRLVAGAPMVAAPPRERALLLLTILASFCAASIAGAIATLGLGAAALALPIALLVGGAVVAYRTPAAAAQAG